MKKVIHYGIYFFACIGFVLTVGFFAVKSGLTNTKSVIIDEQREKFLEKIPVSPVTNLFTDKTWTHSEEWNIFKEAIIKDREDIYKASALTGIPSRLIVAQVAVEQLRLYYSNRDLFKSVFAPLKLLGNQSQFSWGVAGIKEETAEDIEKHLQDTTSPFYPGKTYEHLLDFTTTDHNNERFERIVNDSSRFYSYLYTALYIKEIEAQWQKAGFPIENNVGALSTLFNIGFANSQPHAHPVLGGAQIEIGTISYNFGYIAELFYDSQELETYFPKK